MDEVPEEAIQEVEAGRTSTGPTSAGPTSSGPTRAGHDHEGVTGEDGTLRAHLEEVHQLEVPPRMSASTQAGLHDRVHDDTAAVDD
jgi:hypothetical protein